MMNRTRLILLLIVVIAAILRLSQLTSYPAGFNADEAAIGYNAYSLLKTGHDEHGAAWPLVFKSFGDYKAPLYFYLVLPFVSILGLNEWSVRLPSALFGIATVYLVYLLAKKITQREQLALLAAFVLAISPWHIHFSRGGWEVNVATFFITFGVYAFLQALEKPKWFFTCLLSFLAAMYTYQSPKIIVPILGLGLLIFYANEIKSLLKVESVRKTVLWSIIGAAIIALPLVVTVLGKGGSARFSGVSIFADTGPYWGVNEARGEYSDPSSLPAKIFHNRMLAYGLDYLKNYSDHFTPAFLFFTGDPIERNNIPEFGVQYAIDGIFAVLGIIWLLRSHFRHRKVIFLWLLVAPTAAAITFQTPHALRSAVMVIPLTFFIAAGIYWSLQLVSKRYILGLVMLFFITTAYTYQFAKYLHEYYVHIPKALPYANNYGFNELVPYLESMKSQYPKIVVTDRYDQPYILFLFYSRYNPVDFQRQVVLTPRDKFGFATVRQYDDYEFRAITPDDLVNLKGALVVGSDKEIPDDDERIVKIIRFPNGKPAFKVIKT